MDGRTTSDADRYYKPMPPTPWPGALKRLSVRLPQPQSRRDAVNITSEKGGTFLDAAKRVLMRGCGGSLSEWMTAGWVSGESVP